MKVRRGAWVPTHPRSASGRPDRSRSMPSGSEFPPIHLRPNPSAESPEELTTWIAAVRRIVERVHRLAKGLGRRNKRDELDERRQCIAGELCQLNEILKPVWGRIANLSSDVRLGIKIAGRYAYTTATYRLIITHAEAYTSLISEAEVELWAAQFAECGDDVEICRDSYRRAAVERMATQSLNEYIDKIDPRDIEEILVLLSGVPEPQVQASVANQGGDATTEANRPSPGTQDGEAFVHGLLRIDPPTKTITLGQKTHTVTNARAFNAFLLIAKARGNLVSRQEIQKIPGCKGRPDKVLSPLPEWVRELIPSQQGPSGGYSLTLPTRAPLGATRRNETFKR